MKINREKALAAFQEYTDRYDSSRDMIRLKIEHTYRVCGLCQQIARSLDLPEEEVDIAWLTGLLHDVGRFEQQRVYGTFADADSIDHAKYGARILFGKVWEEKHRLASGSEESLPEEIQEDAGISIRDFVEDASCDELLWTAVFYHSAYRIPEALEDGAFIFVLRQLIVDVPELHSLRVVTWADAADAIRPHAFIRNRLLHGMRRFLPLLTAAHECLQLPFLSPCQLDFFFVCHEESSAPPADCGYSGQSFCRNCRSARHGCADARIAPE